MASPTDHELSRAQAVQDIASSICKAAGDILMLHGDSDPQSPAILMAGFALAIGMITEKIDPTFKKRLMMQLGARS